MSHSFELLFKEPDRDKGNLPSPPVAQIYINSCSRDKDEHILVTPHCISYIEINHEINRLIKELEELRGRAQGKFRQYTIKHSGHTT